MRFSLATIATAALILSASAAPLAPGAGDGGRNNTSSGASGDSGQGSGRASGRGRYPQGTFPSGSFPSRSRGVAASTGGFPGFGTRPSRSRGVAAPTGGLPGSGPTPSGSVTVAPTPIPSGGGDLESVSFDFPNSALARPAAEDDESSNGDSDSNNSTEPTSTKKTKSNTKTKTKTSASGATSRPTPSSSPESDPESDPDSDSGSGTTPGSGSGSNSTTPITPTTPSGGGSGGSASSTFPTAAGESTLSSPMSVTGTFDGGMVRFGRGVSCTGQSEGGDSDAVFIVEDGGTLKNVIIGADQIEGVHCAGSCTIENVYWEAVCEDALSFKGDGDGTVIGGGAKSAADKIIQHNGVGTISISGFYASDFGKLYRSCGNCSKMGKRDVKIDGVLAEGGKVLVGINSNFDDVATITNTCATGVTTVCEEFEGNDTGDEPTSIGEGPSAACVFTEADVAAC